MNQFSSVQLLSTVQLFVTPWMVAHQASLSITNTQSLLKLVSIQSVILSNHLILCLPLLLPPSIFPSLRPFSSESVICIRWLKYWSFMLFLKVVVISYFLFPQSTNNRPQLVQLLMLQGVDCHKTDARDILNARLLRSPKPHPWPQILAPLLTGCVSLANSLSL